MHSDSRLFCSFRFRSSFFHAFVRFVGSVCRWSCAHFSSCATYACGQRRCRRIRNASVHERCEKTLFSYSLVVRFRWFNCWIDFQTKRSIKCKTSDGRRIRSMKLRGEQTRKNRHKNSFDSVHFRTLSRHRYFILFFTVVAATTATNNNWLPITWNMSTLTCCR